MIDRPKIKIQSNDIRRPSPVSITAPAIMNATTTNQVVVSLYPIKAFFKGRIPAVTTNISPVNTLTAIGIARTINEAITVRKTMNNWYAWASKSSGPPMSHNNSPANTGKSPFKYLSFLK